MTKSTNQQQQSLFSNSVQSTSFRNNLQGQYNRFVNWHYKDTMKTRLVLKTQRLTHRTTTSYRQIS